MAGCLRLFSDGTGQRFDMSVGCAAGDHHVVGHGGQLTDVQLDDVFALDLLEGLYHQLT